MQHVGGVRVFAAATKQRVRIGACAILAATAIGAADAARADMFLKLSDIEGESTNARHSREIDVTGIILPILGSVPNGGGKGKASCPSLTVFKNLDKSSPILMKKLAQGVHIPQAVLTVQRSGADQVDYYVLTMDEVFVSEVTQVSEDPSHLADKVAFNARRYTFEYRVQNATGGTDFVKFGWDCVTTQIT
jgi:type VI secretion system secreted protein Hcp